MEVSVSQMDNWTTGSGGDGSSPQASQPQLAAGQVPVDLFGPNSKQYTIYNIQIAQYRYPNRRRVARNGNLRKKKWRKMYALARAPS